MIEKKSSSRRSFLTKITAGSIGTAMAATIGTKAFAGKTPNVVSTLEGDINNAFKSDKKFVPVMLTPYKTNGQVDFDGLSKLMDFYLAAGVKGYFANCNSSEMNYLTPEERLAITRHVVKRVNGSMSVVATGSFGDTLEQKAEFSKQIYHTGINAVIMITGHFAKANESDDVLIKNFDSFFKLTDNIPMGTYECPAPYKRILTPYTFKYLLDSGRMIYHKDTTIDLDKVKAKIALAKGNRLEFYDACVANTMYSLQAGAKGMSAISGNFYPDILAWMCANSTNPDKQDDVKYIQAELTKTEDIIGKGYPASAKYFMRKRGVPIEISSRMSPTPLTTQQTQALDDVYKTLLGWCDRIGIKPAHL